MTSLPTAQALDSKFKLTERGRQRGLDGLPLASQTTPDNVEMEVVGHCNILWKERRSAFIDHRATLQQRFQELSESPFDPESTPVVSNVCKDLEATVKNHRPELEGLQQQAQQAIDDLTRFKHEEQRTAAPDYPESRIWHWGVLAALVLLETLVNGLFFGANVEGGILAGTTYAALIAIVNVCVLGGLIAWMVRNLNHRSPRRKVIAMAVLIAAAVCTLLWNLLVAHYREALLEDYPSGPDSPDGQHECWIGPDPSEADQEAVCLFVENPFRLTGFQSWALFALGLAMCVGAAIDWLKTDDSYPGYGWVDRRRRRMEDRLLDARAELLGELKSIHTRGDSELRANFRDPVETRKIALRDFHKLRDLHDDLQDFSGDLEKTCRDAINIYRTENREARRRRSPRTDQPAGSTLAQPGEPEPPLWRESWKANWEVPGPPNKSLVMSHEKAVSLRTEGLAVIDQQAAELQKCRDKWQNVVIQIARLDPFKGIQE